MHRHRSDDDVRRDVCDVHMLFGAELEHSVDYFAWTVVSAVSAFGGAYLAISGLRTAKKAGSQQTS